MSRIEVLKRNYQRICALPWARNVAGAQRVWFAVYDKEDERKLRCRMDLFAEATQAGAGIHQEGHQDPALRVEDVRLGELRGVGLVDRGHHLLGDRREAFRPAVVVIDHARGAHRARQANRPVLQKGPRYPSVLLDRPSHEAGGKED